MTNFNRCEWELPSDEIPGFVLALAEAAKTVAEERRVFELAVVATNSVELVGVS